MKDEYNLATVQDLRSFEKDSASEFFTDRDRAVRNRMLYTQELKKGVELGRKLGKLQVSVANARAFASKQIQFLVTKQRVSPQSAGIMMMRNMVRLMKGKNQWK